MFTVKTRTQKKIKSPLNYIGGKYKILTQILPLFPKNINNFVDLFTGGCNIGINVEANTIYCNDNLIYLIDMYKSFQNQKLEKVINHIQKRIYDFGLSLTNELGYREIREFYNQNKNPLDLFVLIAYSFNHQIRFNNNHQFNNPFGKERSSFNDSMKHNLENFMYRLEMTDIEFTSQDFTDFDFSFLDSSDFVYCDPPYLITTGTYNDGKRGFTGWGKEQEYSLLEVLDSINGKQIKFALSNVIEHKGKSNQILKDWIEKNSDYQVNFINMNYANSNYQTVIRDKNASVEVLITNYKTIKPLQNKTLFDLF